MPVAVLNNVTFNVPAGNGSVPYPAHELNTGYQNAGALLGGGPYTYADLSDGSSLSLQDNTTYSLLNFDYGLSPSNFASGINPVNVTFIGCRFEGFSSMSNQVIGGWASGAVTFRYCTVEPGNIAPGSEPPLSNPSYQCSHSDGYQYAWDCCQGTTIDHCRAWGFANACQIWSSSASLPFVITNSLFQNPRQDGGTDHTDGPGDQVTRTLDSVTLSGCTVVGVGNTNAISFQGGTYTNIAVTGCYAAGFGYMVFLGTVGAGGQDTHTFTFQDNIWGTDVEPALGPTYVNYCPFTQSGATARGNIWSGNKISTYAGTNWMAAGNDGLYWWPTDTTPGGPSQIIGHASDYVNP